MWQYGVAVAGAAVAAGVLASTLAENFTGETKTDPVVVEKSASVQSSSTPSASAEPVLIEPYAGRKAVIQADRRGHFVTKARMNGRKLDVLVDTGATSVAINKSTARRLGIHLISSDFKYRVSTANGTVKAAVAIIDRVEIGRVYVKDVRAAVLPDKSLNEVLLGMSFLGELKKFEVSNGKLVLTQ